MRELKWRLHDNWTFKACDEQDWMPAKVPGCVHTDLLRNKSIPDPFYGTNESQLLEVSASLAKLKAVVEVESDGEWSGELRGFTEPGLCCSK